MVQLRLHPVQALFAQSERARRKKTMTNYITTPTSAEVWAVIRARHPELRPFGTYSAPCGDQFGDPSKGVMFTSLGFEKADYPIMEAKTTWDIDSEKPYARLNEKTEYWLCLPIEGE
jgi:hypothetical protein